LHRSFWLLSLGKESNHPSVAFEGFSGITECAKISGLPLFFSEKKSG
jgi:hypothetical protein